MKDLRKTYIGLLAGLRDFSCAIHYLRKRNIDRALNDLKQGISYMETGIGHALEICFSTFGDRKLETEFMSALEVVFRAQGMEDYLLLADSLEQQINPVMKKILHCVRNNIKEDDYDLWDVNIEKSMNFLKESYDENKELFEELQKVEYDRNKYQIVSSQTGLPALRITEKDEQYYLNSSSDPWIESLIAFESIVTEVHEEYHVYGMELTYFSQHFLHEIGPVTVHVYEGDINVIRICLGIAQAKILYEDFHIRIHYDPDFSKFTSVIRQKQDNAIIQMTSIRNIGNREVRNLFQSYYMRNVAYSSFKNRMQANFLYNIKHVAMNCDVLKEKVINKKVYIVAAGPSLDRNMMKLKEKKTGEIIIAVGTCARKLVKADIVPDYVVVLDPKDSIWNQFIGLENHHIPVIIVSTACVKIAEKYMGEKYLAFQSGYQPAENLAKENGATVFQTGGSVSTLAFDIAVSFMAREINFLGLDLAYTNNLAHADGAGNQTASDRDRLFPVDNYSRDGVAFTDARLDSYRKWFIRRISEARNMGYEGRIINGTEGGVYIEGMEHKPIND